MDPVKWFNISNGLAFFGGLLTLSGIIGLWYFGNINARNTNIEIQNRKTETAKANAEAAKANEKAASLELQVAKANEETENAKAIAESAKLKATEINLKVKEAQIEAENAKIEREKLKQKSLLLENKNENLKTNLAIERQQRYESEMRIEPRSINQSPNVFLPLQNFKKIELEVYYVDSGEPFRVVGQLGILFQFCDWKIIKMEPVTSTMIRDGIIIESNVGPKKDETREAATELEKQLNEMGVQTNLRPAHPELPINTLRIIIGHKPQKKESTEPNN